MIRRLALGALALVLAACDAPEPDYAPRFTADPPTQLRTLVLGVHPLHNPKRLFEVYQPLVDHLNAGLQGVRIRLEASNSYGAFDEKMAARRFDLALPNPYQTLNSLGQGYRVFGKMADDGAFRGIILVRRDSGIDDPADLKGKAVSYPAPTALAATMMPQWFLHRQGIDVMRELENRYVGSQESSIMNVQLGHVAAGATWPAPWRAFQREHPDLAAQLRVAWETEPLVNNGLVARDDVPAETVARIGALLFAMTSTEAGRAILAPMEVAGFEAADDKVYDRVRRFLVDFERDVRPARGTP
ncbi:MAG TPA: PhnD/SsuA/transferrin family substrate-binding protein [Azospirillaceae bacterium]|nr:PhnD/SsuA/transferrin family substrate-binding protein [Azospirillaceae bacterium]